MYKLLPLLLLTSCATAPTTPSQKLADLHRATTSVVTAMTPLFEEACSNEAYACAQQEDESCPRLVACDKLQQQFVRTVVALYKTLMVADVALAVNDFEGAMQAIAKATIYLNELREYFVTLGVTNAE